MKRKLEQKKQKDILIHNHICLFYVKLQLSASIQPPILAEWFAVNVINNAQYKQNNMERLQDTFFWTFYRMLAMILYY